MGAWLARVGGESVFDLGYAGPESRAAIEGDEAFFSPVVPVRVDGSQGLPALRDDLGAALERAASRGVYARDLVARLPDVEQVRYDVVLAPRSDTPVAGSALTITSDALHYDPTRMRAEAAAEHATRLGIVAAAVAASPDAEVAALPLLSEDERRTLLDEWNDTARDVPTDRCVHESFELQVERTPDAPALVFEGETLTYRQLNARANGVAAELRRRGVGPESLVGLYVDRSIELVVGALGIMKAGGAYLPLDPDYPAERIALMLEDSRASVVVARADLAEDLPAGVEELVVVDDVAPDDGPNPQSGVHADNLAYVIYTSGSTGRPKGVMVEHRNVINFFVGMDERVPHEDGGVWLAVTSLSFDISVLELFWTLARGFKVVVYRDRRGADDQAAPAPIVTSQPMDFGLFYWGNDDGPGPRKYRLLLESAKFADAHGFSAVWTPERHFHAFGGPYPNPSVTGAAVAAVTENIGIRAGSCVVPLHHPLRVAEEWAVVDNLCNGRVGLACAAGWQPDDFVLRPENAPPNNRQSMLDTIDILRRLWRGEAVEFSRGDDESVAVVSQPRPVQETLPIWVTTAGNPQTYRDAAAMGANVLTHLLGQSIDEVAEKIKIYREALVEHGHDPSQFKVTLMLHTLVGHDREVVRELAREPMKDYLRSAANLIKQYAWAFPAFKRPQGVEKPVDVDLQSLSEEELDAILEFAFLRYFEDSGLFGTVEDCIARTEQLKAIGVDEIACLIDYGVAPETVLEAMKPLAEVVRRTNPGTDADEEGVDDADHGFAALVKRHGVTHMQCTPSMARMLLMDGDARTALGGIRHLMVGGEALPGALVAELREATQASIENMYGPTETTIWSSTQPADATHDTTPIGTPIANTQLYVLDAGQSPVPVGVAGELYIGGDGVTRGYLHRDTLTAERFLADPFRGNGARMYRTGDLVTWRADGTVDFLGRVDHQVKLRGYRIELGEIEARLAELDDVRDVVVVVREDVPGDGRLLAYLTTHGEVEQDRLRDHLRGVLPEYMVPTLFLVLPALPLTPNKKIDRGALPAPEDILRTAPREEGAAPKSEVAKQIAVVWQEVLGVPFVGAGDNFFELGGHSLLAVQAHRELKTAVSETLSITDIFRFPTIDALAAHVEGRGESQAKLAASADRAAGRREAMAMRRQRRRQR